MVGKSQVGIAALGLVNTFSARKTRFGILQDDRRDLTPTDELLDQHRLMIGADEKRNRRRRCFTFSETASSVISTEPWNGVELRDAEP